MTAPALKLTEDFDDEVARVIHDDAMEARSAEEILAWAIERFHPRLVLSASFGGAEGMVVLDMMHRIEPASRVFMLDTGRIHQATYDLVDRVRDRYDKKVEVVFPNHEAVEAMVADKGHNLFYESQDHRKLCCRIRKVEPLRRFLGGVDAYVSGLRRDQNANRANTRKVEFDQAAGGIVKLNPLADWTHDEVWRYVAEHPVPVSRLHREGYPSVGCGPCTRAIKHGEDPRAGRWWWENDDTRECGIHLGEEEGGSGI
ncbi:MAG: phosphoadenylyl-sulfate reductase [Myxococcota bacterium]|jgi:phosphoadenosine phosphosulfate reductase|nr:phosphoadenylyl-sulfate reductase [Myxococcota bacterium]